MSLKLRWLVGLTAVVLTAACAYFIPEPPPTEPFEGRAWSVDSVMLLHPETATSYVLAEPFRVVRNHRLTLSRSEVDRTSPVVRVDLTIDGEPVIVYSRLRK